MSCAQLEEEDANNGEDPESDDPRWNQGSDRRIHGPVG